jgi:prepilin-type N-terminal cleavage/methylation domain-containing protein
VLTRRPAPRRRAGFTLIELLVSLALFALVLAAVMGVLIRQQRFYASAADLIAVRTSLRELANTLPTDLRAISSGGGDIYAMSDSAIDFRLPSGASVVCSINAGRTQITVPPVQLASRTGASGWVTAPVSGDSLFILDEGATTAAGDDSWPLFSITATPSAGACTTFTGSAAEANASLTLNVSPALPATVVVGSAIRFFRHAKYKLYQPAGSTNWYLGYQECPGGVCGAMQAVSGPFLPYAAAGASGLRFTYRDSTGAVTATPANVARIDVTVLAQTRSIVRMPGRADDYYRDSLVVSIALRNRT